MHKLIIRLSYTIQNDLSEVKDFHQKCLCVTGFINPWGAEGYCSCLVQIG